MIRKPQDVKLQEARRDLIITRLLADGLLDIIHAAESEALNAAAMRFIRRIERLQKDTNFKPNLCKDG